MGESVKEAIGAVQEVVIALLSWTILVAASIIISGKLFTKRLPIGIKGEDHFSLPLVFVKLKSSGEEVVSGFLLFILSLGMNVIFGGREAYAFFKDHTGLDIGQWRSLCAMAGFISLAFSTMVCVVVPLFKAAPLVDEGERAETNERLRNP